MRLRREKETGQTAALASLAPPALPIAYRVPAGESGAAAPPRARRTDSIMRLYAFEQTNAAFQRLRARRQARSFRLRHQRVQIRTAIGADKRPVAVSGETTTTLVDADGRRTVLSELAYLSDIRRVFVSGPSRLFGEGRRIIPPFALFDAFASRLRVEEDRRAVLSAQGPPGVIGAVRPRQGAPAEARASSARSLAERLSDLARAGRAILADPGFFAGGGGGRVRVSDPFVVSAAFANRGGGEVREGTARVRVLELARGLAVASDPVADAAAPLGLSGNLVINDLSVRIAPEDGLGAIMRRINQGEDINGNGLLNNEDRNFNGQLDPGEDLDGDNVLDPDEDRNFNGRLDPGLARSGIGIRARIERNRLVLEADRADLTVRFRDPDRILRAIGLLEVNPNGEEVAKTVLATPRFARVELDGKILELPKNVLALAAPAVEVTLLGLGSATVTANRSFSEAAERLRGFLEVYNGLLSELNRLLLRGGVFEREPAPSRVRRDLARPVEGDGDLAAAGLSAAPSRRWTIHQLQLALLRSRLARGLPGPFDGPVSVRAVANTLATLGIGGVGEGLVDFDADRFAAALSEAGAPARAAALSSVVTGLVEVAERAVDPMTGRLTLLSARLAEDSALLPELARTLEELFAARRRIRDIGTVADMLG